MLTMANRITLKTIAETCHINTSAVSRILGYDDPRYNVKTRELVKETAIKLGYKPNLLAQSVRTGKTGIVGLILCPMKTSLAPDDFPADLVKGIDTELINSGYQILLSRLTLDQVKNNEIPKMISGGYVEGIIFHGHMLQCDYWMRLKEHCPNLVIAENLYPGIDSVCHDEYASGALIGEHFYKQGYKKIAVIDSDDEEIRHQLRIAGLQDKLNSLYGTAVKIDIYRDYAWDEKCGRNAVKAMLAASAKPDAIMAINDYFAAHAIFELQESGIHVPNDIAVAGIGCSAGILISPALTSVYQNRVEAGRKSAQVLLKNISGGARSTTGNEIIPVNLKINQSTNRQNVRNLNPGKKSLMNIKYRQKNKGGCNEAD
jgi:DNA-binding LacI/PurR family transcriptional regulator